MADIGFPGKPVEAAKTDVLTPLKALLEGLHLLSRDADIDNAELLEDKKTPPSVQVIRTGALDFSKDAKAFAQWATGAGVVSGLAGVVAWVTDAKPITQAAFVLGGAGIIIAALFVIAIVVHTDVQARAIATASRFQARATVAHGFVAAVEDLSASARKTVVPAKNGKADAKDSREVAALLMDALGAAKVVEVNLVGDGGDDAYKVLGLRDAVGTEAQVELEGGKTTGLSTIRGFHAIFPAR